MQHCMLCGHLLPKDKVAVIQRTNAQGPMRLGSSVGIVCASHSLLDLMATGIGVTLSKGG